MYRRYSSGSVSGLTMDQRKAVRNRNIVILALVIIIAVLCVIGIPALRSKSDNHMLFVQRMRSECDEAIRLTNTLSRNAGADSAGLLARIRSNIYSMDVINTLSINQDGLAGTIVDSSRLMSIVNIIDQYQSVIITGMATGEQQTALLKELEEVNTILYSVE